MTTPDTSRVLPRIDRQLCSGCGLCELLCSTKAVEMRNGRRGRRGGRGAAERLGAGPRPRPVAGAPDPERCDGRAGPRVLEPSPERGVEAERAVVERAPPGALAPRTLAAFVSPAGLAVPVGLARPPEDAARPVLPARLVVPARPEVLGRPAVLERP